MIIHKNKKGVQQIRATDNALIAEYAYDAWGNCTVTRDENGIGSLNAIRYRGYYYDVETGLYYLLTRYYDPETGRFISPDDVSYLDPETMNGLNLFAYCNNNPVMNIDPIGTSWLIALAILATMLFTPIGGTAVQTMVSVSSFVGMAVASIWDEEIRENMTAIHWNPFNSDESAVLSSIKVSFYKGVPVFRIDEKRSASFGAIFLTENSGVDDLRHERGHNWQLMMMGVGTYGFTVGIPSPLCLGKWFRASNYYGAPWETMADILGGVQGRTHSKLEIANAWSYYIVSTLAFPFTGLYWF